MIMRMCEVVAPDTQEVEGAPVTKMTEGVEEVPITKMTEVEYHRGTRAAEGAGIERRGQ